MSAGIKNTQTVVAFPVQTISDAKKNSEWYEECVKAAESLYTFDNAQVRATWYNKRINLNLRNNILTQQDVEKFVNPSGIKISTMPERMAHQGLANAKITLLKGEESRRLQKYEFKAFLSNAGDDGSSSKEELLKEKWTTKINELIQNPDLTEEQIQAELQKYQKYLRYSVQDVKEIVANKIMRYEYERLDMSDKLTNAYESMLVFGEEIMCIEAYADELYARYVNPLNLFTIQSPDSPYIEDSDVIVEYSYMSIGEVRELYYDELDEEQTKNLELGYEVTTNAGSIRPGINRNISIEERYGFSIGDLFLPNQVSPGFFSGAFDMRGNVRVLRVCWRSPRKLGKLKTYDEYGVPISEIVSEHYTPDKSKGETVDWFWVNEWRETHKIGNDIYVRKRVIPYQGRSPHNLSDCTPPYVGVICNFNQSRVMSLYDYMKPTDYLYDIVFYRFMLALSKYKGPMTVINKSMIPAEMDPVTFMNFVDNTNVMFLDPTREILKGQNQGKSAGIFNTLTANSIQSQMGSYVKDHLEMLKFLSDQMDNLSGINYARQGDFNSSDKVGNSNMAWSASNSMTEPYNRLHNLFKKKVMRKLLNVAQYVWSKNPKKAQYVLNDMGAEVVSYWEDISDVVFDVHVSNSSQLDEIQKAIEALIQPMAQNGQVTMSQVGNMYLKDSISETLRYLEDLELSNEQKQQQAAQAEMEHEQALKQAEAEIEQNKLELEYDKLDREDINKQLDRENKIYIEEIKALGFAENTDVNANAIPDVVEQGKLALEHNKLAFEQFNKNKEAAFKQKELQIKEKELAHKESVEKLKIKQTEIQNKSQERIANQQIKLKEKEIKSKERIAKARPKPSSKK